MTKDEELELIAKWQSSAEGKAELALHGLILALDDLDTREGAKTISINHRLSEEIRKTFAEVFGS